MGNVSREVPRIIKDGAGSSDSQAALKRLKSREVKAGQYYTNQARTGIEKLRQKNNQMQINLQ